MKRLLNTAFIYAIAAMAGGVFYREFTKFSGFSGRTSLAFIHTHLFMLGMFFFLAAALFQFHAALDQDRRFRIFYWIYNSGIVITTIGFAWRGVVQVRNLDISKGMDAAVSGVSGIGHILTGIGLVLFFLILKKQTANK